MNPDQLAKEALNAYPIALPTTTFLRHNENITFRVVDTRTNEAYLLRIHSPLAEAFRGERQLPEVIASELCWLEGEPFPTLPSGVHAERLGVIVATLHAHARSWSFPGRR